MTLSLSLLLNRVLLMIFPMEYTALQVRGFIFPFPGFNVVGVFLGRRRGFSLPVVKLLFGGSNIPRNAKTDLYFF